jgi:hypothetical protein
MKIRSRCDRCGTVNAESMISKDCPNLWEPSACAGNMQRYEIIEHVGTHAHRLGLGALSFREDAFADEWKSENQAIHERSCMDPTLARLLGRMPTQDEATAVATVIQWLGSNCGQGFLHAVQARIMRSPHTHYPTVANATERTT